MNKKTIQIVTVLLFMFFCANCPKPPVPPPVPETITIDVCGATGLLPNAYCPAIVKRTFEKGKEPATVCAVHKKPIEYVKVKVCQTTSLLPNKYCPSIVEKQFEEGKEPTAVCSVHKPDKSKRPLFVFIPDIITAAGDLQAFLDKVVESGAWGIRIFANFSWGRGWHLTPFFRTGSWIHPTTEKVFPLFDLGTWNQEYWPRLKAACLACKARDLEVTISIMDVRPMDKNEKYFSPWYCSIQALSPESANGVYGDYLKPFHYRLAKLLTDKMIAWKVKYRIEIANEFSDLGWADEGRPDIPRKWYSAFVSKLKSYDIPASRMIHSGWKEAVYNQGGIFSNHRIVTPEKLSDLSYPASDRPRILISGDGGFDGAGRADEEGRKGVSVTDARTIAIIIETLNYYGYEFMDRGLWKKDNSNADLDDFDFAPAAAMTKIWQ